jgi:phage recombination protein Bet
MTEIAVRQHDGGITQFDPIAGERRELLKRTICRDLTDNEFDLFVAVCNRRRLDPFVRQIHAVKRRQWNSKINDYEDVMVIQTGIDGFRLIAERTHERDGTDGPWWCDDTGQWREAWFSTDPPAAAKFTTYRKGHARGYVGIAHWTEYVQTYKDKKGNLRPTQMWESMPAGQLAKCAEALAWRKAFPEELAGIYTDDEMGQADNGGHTMVKAPGGPAAEPVPAGPPAPTSRMPTLEQIRDITSVQQARGLVKTAPQHYQETVEEILRARYPQTTPSEWWKTTKDIQAWRGVLLDALDPSTAAEPAPPPAAVDTTSGGTDVRKGKPHQVPPGKTSPSAPVPPDAGRAEGDNHPRDGAA